MQRRTFLKIGDRFTNPLRTRGGNPPSTYVLIDGGRGFPMACRIDSEGNICSGAIEIGFLGIYTEKVNGQYQYYSYDAEVIS
jgi:hypothetical protein